MTSRYHDLLRTFREGDIIPVVARSQQTLVVWATFCIVHQTAKYQRHCEALLRPAEFPVALKYTDLEHLVRARVYCRSWTVCALSLHQWFLPTACSLCVQKVFGVHACACVGV